MFGVIFFSAAAVLLQCVPSNGYIVTHPKRDEDNQVIPNETPKRKELQNFIRMRNPLNSTRYEDGLVVECRAMGFPAPSVLWMKNGDPVTDFEESNEIGSKSPGSLATITSRLVVPAPVEGDVFTCVGLSDMKETSAVMVYEEVVDSEVLSAMTKPIITDFYKNLFQPMGTSVTLPCRVFSSSLYEIVWLDNEYNVVYENSRMRVLPSGDLRIHNLVWPDMGEYTCVAQNKHGKATQTTFLYPNTP